MSGKKLSKMTPMAMLLGVIAIIGIVSAAIIISNVVVVNTHVMKQPVLSFDTTFNSDGDIYKDDGGNKYTIINPVYKGNDKYEIKGGILQNQTYLTGVRLQSTEYTADNVIVKFVITGVENTVIESVDDITIKYLENWNYTKNVSVTPYWENLTLTLDGNTLIGKYGHIESVKTGFEMKHPFNATTPILLTLHKPGDYEISMQLEYVPKTTTSDE
jgi:hypothetical protein